MGAMVMRYEGEPGLSERGSGRDHTETQVFSTGSGAGILRAYSRHCSPTALGGCSPRMLVCSWAVALSSSGEDAPCQQKVNRRSQKLVLTRGAEDKYNQAQNLMKTFILHLYLFSTFILQLDLPQVCSLSPNVG